MSEVKKFRKRPIVIEAMGWDGTAKNATPVIEWIFNGGGTATYRHDPKQHGYSLGIETLEGTMRAVAGDWIIRGVAGEFYPCRGDIFAATYEQVPDE